MVADAPAEGKKGSGAATAQAGQTMRECPGHPYPKTRALPKARTHACRRFWEARQDNRAWRQDTCQDSSTNVCKREGVPAGTNAEKTLQQQVPGRGSERPYVARLAEHMRI